jgi:hypothetical protein
MVKGRVICAEVQQIIVRMTTSFSDNEISMYTGVSIRKVQEIRRHFDKTGMVTVPVRSRPKSKRSLSDEDIEVRNSPLYSIKH